MERKILTIMVALMVVAAIVVAFVMIAAGGVRTAGGFTRLFDDLENPNPTVTFHQYLELPDDWSINDVKTVSDTIVDMYLDYTTTVGSSTIYVHVIYFVCISDKWTDVGAGHVVLCAHEHAALGLHPGGPRQVLPERQLGVELVRGLHDRRRHRARDGLGG